MNEDKLLEPREVASWLNIKPRTVVTLAAAGELPGIRIGARLWRFSRADLVAYLAKKRQQPMACGTDSHG